MAERFCNYRRYCYNYANSRCCAVVVVVAAAAEDDGGYDDVDGDYDSCARRCALYAQLVLAADENENENENKNKKGEIKKRSSRFVFQRIRVGINDRIVPFFLMW